MLCESTNLEGSALETICLPERYQICLNDIAAQGAKCGTYPLLILLALLSTIRVEIPQRLNQVVSISLSPRISITLTLKQVVG
jgi:hypothetical protein